MISGVRVTNFKAFGETQRMPIKPLTFLYGPNSGGKSSLIHALVLAAHARQTGDIEARPARCGFDQLDLGGFTQYVHQHDICREVEITLELRIPGLRDQVLGTAAPESYHAPIAPTVSEGERISVGMAFGCPSSEAPASLRGFRLDVDDAHLVSLRRNESGLLAVQSLNARHPFLVGVASARWDRANRCVLSPAQLGALSRIAAGMRRNAVAAVETLLPIGLVPDRPPRRRDMTGPKSAAREATEGLRPLLFGLLHDLLAHVGAAAYVEVVEYLGPLRGVPSLGPGGAPEAVQSDLGAGLACWLPRHWYSEAFGGVLNQWLGSQGGLAVPYAIEFRSTALTRRLEQALDWGVTPFLGPAIAGLRQTEQTAGLPGAVGQATPEATDAIRQAISGLAQLVASQLPYEPLEPVIVDLRTGTEVRAADIGVGISQVVPVLIVSLGCGLVAIEQPEVHLHPALQAKLADFLISEALSWRLEKQFILETHSEHLLLRVMRRMRETAQGRLPETSPPVTPDDVAVLYVEPRGPQSVVHELQLDEDGSLLDPWPGGFFEEGFYERFS